MLKEMIDLEFKTSIVILRLKSHGRTFQLRCRPLEFLKKGFIISHVGPGIFTETDNLYHIIGYLNSAVSTRLLSIINSSIHFYISPIMGMPYRQLNESPENTV